MTKKVQKVRYFQTNKKCIKNLELTLYGNKTMLKLEEPYQSQYDIAFMSKCMLALISQDPATAVLHKRTMCG